MNKQEAKELLLSGKSIDEIFELSDGQECWIYKSEWPSDSSSDQIIYIPDIDLNEMDDGEISVDEKLSHMYTAADFLDQTNGNLKAAECLFNFVDWQNPNIQDVMDCTDDDEAKELFGQTWEEMFQDDCGQKEKKNNGMVR